MKNEFDGITEIDVVDLLWALDGTSLHYMFEKASSEDIAELRLVTKFEDISITGKIDLYELESKRLLDYKKTSVYTYLYHPTGKKEYIAQANVNSFLLRANGFEVNSAVNVYFFRDWRKSEYLKLQNRGYPFYPIRVIDLPLWSDEEVVNYISARLAAHKKAKIDWQLGVLNGCTPEGRWREEDEYAVLTQTRTKAMNGAAHFKTRQEAEDFASLHKNGGIEYRPGKDKRCDDWCSYKTYCSYFKKKTLSLGSE